MAALVAQQCVVRVCPKHARLDSGQRACWPFHTLYCFSFKHVLHQTSSMWSGIIILENKGFSNNSSVRDDMRSKTRHAYLRPVKVPFRMICRSVRPPMLIPPHTIQPALLYCDLHERMRGYFVCSCPFIQEHVGCHTLD
ncbi:hypothetical protein TNCV_1868221 [Trichonephila clavipes]|nr:hypothetical protein TNCV_1868221 [Trichonephila clavipes]